MPYKHGERTLPLDVGFKLNGEQFPSNWLRLAPKDAKTERGIVWEADPVYTFKDKRWYNNRVVDGEVISTPKDLDGLKEKMIGDAKRTAHNLLSGSDWMVIRETEADVATPQDWADYRVAVRAESNRQEEQVAQANDIDALASITTSNWPENPDQKAKREAQEAALLESDE